MALAATVLASAYNNADVAQSTGYTTASISPAANSLLILDLGICSAADAGPPVITTTLSGVTFTQVGFDLDGGRNMGVWWAQCGATPGTGTLTFKTTTLDTTLTGGGWWVIQVTGHNSAAPIRQFKLTGGDGAAYTTSAGTLDSAIGHANNRVMMFTAIRLNSAITPRASWVELGPDVGAGTPAMAFHCSWRNDGTNETAFSSTFASARHQTFAIEIVADSGVTWPFVEPFTYTAGSDLYVANPARWGSQGTGSIDGTPVEAAPFTYGGGVAAADALADCYLSRLVVALPSNDQYAKMKAILAANQEAWVLIRGAADGVTGYAAWFYENGAGFLFGLYRVDAGVSTALGTDIGVTGGTHIIEVRAVGNTISSYLDGALVTSTTDATYPTARGSSIMLHSASAALVTCDDFEEGTAVATATGRPKVWTGSAWAQKPLKVWSGSAWVEKPVKVWTGSVWKTIT